VNGDDPLGLAAGARVAVSPDDYGRDAVVGELVTLTPDEIAVRRDTDELGAVTVHFPRIGYRVTAE
jgi:hypothetical protein